MWTCFFFLLVLLLFCASCLLGENMRFYNSHGFIFFFLKFFFFCWLYGYWDIFISIFIVFLFLFLILMWFGDSFMFFFFFVFRFLEFHTLWMWWIHKNWGVTPVGWRAFNFQENTSNKKFILIKFFICKCLSFKNMSKFTIKNYILIKKE